MISASTQIPTLLVRVVSRRCARPLEGAVETMQPLLTESIQNRPPFVRGLATVRGLRGQV